MLEKIVALILTNLLFVFPVLSNNIKFIENKGQWEENVIFKADIPAGKLFLEKNALVYVFYDPEVLKRNHHAEDGDHHHSALKEASQNFLPMHSYKVKLLDSQTESLKGDDASLENYNFYIGNNQAKWVSGAKGYGEVVYQDVYKGIDMKLYSTGNEPFKYDFIVKAGASADKIIMQVEGAEKLFLKYGHLHIKTSVNEVIEQKPFAYQLIKNDTVVVPCNYILNNSNVSFIFPNGYDKTQPLIIDPLLIFSTYSGSYADNWGNTATYDSKGNLYSGGTVFSVGFPTTLGAFQTSFGGYRDIGILKYDSLGQRLLYATHIGGSSAETPHSMIVDNSGDLLILGTTSSVNYPVSNTAYNKIFKGGEAFTSIPDINYEFGSDIVVTKIAEDGSSLVASTLIGGLGNDGILYESDALLKNYGDQLRGDIIVDRDNNVYVASNTRSADFPVINGFSKIFGGGGHDGVVFKLNANLSELVWSSFLGGAESDGAFSIKLDADNNVFIGGGTSSVNFPTTVNSHKPVFSGEIDGFVTCIDKDGQQILFSTFIGTPGYDQVYFIDLDPAGDIFLLGQTRGSMPVIGNVYSQPDRGQFIQKLSKDLSSLLLSTTFGSGYLSPNISLTAFMVNDCGKIYLSGWGGVTNGSYIGGNTSGLKVTSDAFQRSTDGSDFYLMVLSQDIKELEYATFFGGNNFLRGEHVDGGTSRFDKRGIIYHAVCAGCGGSQIFPTTPGVWSRTNNSENCNNAAFKFDLATLSANIEVDVTKGCAPLQVNFHNNSSGGKYLTLSLGDGTVFHSFSDISYTYEDPGVYPVVLKIEDESTCQSVDYAYTTISVFASGFGISDSDTICYGSQIPLIAQGGIQYQWRPPDGLSSNLVPDPIANPLVTTQYFVHIADANGCEKEETVTVYVTPELSAEFEFVKKHDCKEFPYLDITNNSIGATDYFWDFGDGYTSSEKEPVHHYLDSGQYQVKLTTSTPGCSRSISQPVLVQKLIVPNVFTPNGDKYNPTFKITTDLPMKLKVMNRWGREVYTNDDYKNDWAAEELNAGVYYYEVTFSDSSVCKGWLHILK